MHDKLFEAALCISAPWSVKSVEFDAAAKLLTVLIDFAPGTRFGAPGLAGQLELKLTRFRGHLTVNEEGVRNARYQAAVSGGVSTTDH